MLNFIKKQSVATWITLGALLLGLVAAILYGVNVGGAGYFHSMAITEVIVFVVLGLVFTAAVLVLAQFEFGGIVKIIVDFITDALRIVIPALYIAGLLFFVNARVQGLAYILFSNPDVLAIIQTTENMSSANTAIAGFVLFAITGVVAMVAAFFGLRKKEKKAQSE